MKGNIITTNNKTCWLCGQRLTDASGKWALSFTEYGLMSYDRDMQLHCCSACVEDKIAPMFKKLKEENDA